MEVPEQAEQDQSPEESPAKIDISYGLSVRLDEDAQPEHGGESGGECPPSLHPWTASRIIEKKSGAGLFL